MESKEHSVLEYNIDKNKVPPIEQKRIVAFINHFVVSTVTFLNKFAVNCETKFIDFESKLQKVEASLVILEAKLATIPGIKQTAEIPTPTPSAPIESTSKNVASSDPGAHTTATTDTVDQVQISSPTTVDAENNNSEIVTVPMSGVETCDDVRYKKYFKMMQFGVPAPAVKLKMEAEGVDSRLLDEPNKILEDGISSPPPEN